MFEMGRSIVIGTLKVIDKEFTNSLGKFSDVMELQKVTNVI